jgi:hypothetical protein
MPSPSQALTTIANRLEGGLVAKRRAIQMVGLNMAFGVIGV